jgi:hypothetical protein
MQQARNHLENMKTITLKICAYLINIQKILSNQYTGHTVLIFKQNFVLIELLKVAGLLHASV